ncbi:hypothetical protein GOP47_0011056, partial [Adiantum capillus-veneris]
IIPSQERLLGTEDEGSGGLPGSGPPGSLGPQEGDDGGSGGRGSSPPDLRGPK